MGHGHRTGHTPAPRGPVGGTHTPGCWRSGSRRMTPRWMWRRTHPPTMRRPTMMKRPVMKRPVLWAGRTPGHTLPVPDTGLSRCSANGTSHPHRFCRRHRLRPSGMRHPFLWGRPHPRCRTTPPPGGPAANRRQMPRGAGCPHRSLRWSGAGCSIGRRGWREVGGPTGHPAAYAGLIHVTHQRE